ncbi:MAG: hypothetical protein E6243_09125 [Cutibacterium avidum]|nr:hypothetical protein [Cutibacterium avidum]MDK7365261.1 hypothetical protein [Cutibacterium avidum]MDU1360293.1 hypothetical protein [Cutibacterium avidum]MDU1417579.1 hypothetical protein [Cutibacterium avidum]MDU1726487.1 hypothetical protein [Cutibacterium avidum]MDU2372571.1 hypothetical protein [Cutibacterium avidum]
MDGVICGSDQIARGAVDALREEGRSIPGMSLWWAMTTGRSSPPARGLR